MKSLKYFFVITLVLAVAASCKKENNDDTSFVQTATAPAKLTALFNIAQDNSGLVTITPNGEGASSYDIYYGDTTAKPVAVSSGNSTQHTYTEGVYPVRIVAHGLSGKTAEVTQQLTVSFRAPEDLAVTITPDAVNKFKVNVTATATYETEFKVYFGDVPNEFPQTFVEGASVTHTYTATGNYNIRVVAVTGGAATAELTKPFTVSAPVLLPLTFEATANYAFSNFGGGDVTIISNPQPNGINTSAMVGKMVKNAGEVYGGSVITLGGSIDFSTSKIFKMKVFSPRVGAKVLLKVENTANTSLNYEKEVMTTVANAWEELTFDYTGINTANTYQNVVLIFDLGTMGDGSPNFTFLFDDITL